MEEKPIALLGCDGNFLKKYLESTNAHHLICQMRNSRESVFITSLTGKPHKE
jgi:hypothetical protein